MAKTLPMHARETTPLLQIKRGGTQQALPVMEVAELVAPRNRERDGCAGAFEVVDTADTPPDFLEHAARYVAA